MSLCCLHFSPKLECGQTLNNSGRHLVLPGLLLYSTSDTQNLNFPPKSLLTLRAQQRQHTTQKRTLYIIQCSLLDNARPQQKHYKKAGNSDFACQRQNREEDLVKQDVCRNYKEFVHTLTHLDLRLESCYYQIRGLTKIPWMQGSKIAARVS